MQWTGIRAVLLDMGGVILQMEHARGFPVERLDWRGRQALLQHIRLAGGHLELEDLDRLLFSPWRTEYERRRQTGREASWSPHLERLRRHSQIQSSDLELLSAWFRPYGELLEPIDGVEAALQELRSRNLGVALISNVPLPGRLYREILEREGLAGYFDQCFFSYDCGTRKPSPAMLRLALAALRAEPGAAVMVGDRRDRDVAAGLAAGTATVWVQSADGGGPRPDATLTSLAALPALLRDGRPRRSDGAP